MAEDIYRIATAHTIGAGNPNTALAAVLSAQRMGLEADFFTFPGVSSLATSFHQSVTSDPERAAEYIETSEAERAGFKGKALGALSLPEFALQCLARSQGRPIQWNVAQELPLRSAPDWLLKKLSVVDARVLVPDVFPKETAKDAVMRHDIARMSVWNQDAYDELRADGVRVELNRPYLLDGMRPDTEEFMQQGSEVVVKFSGSGAPTGWIWGLEGVLDNLTQKGHRTALHAPTYNVKDSKYNEQTDFIPQMHSFYEDLGGNTRILIGYPSELVGLVCELRSQGVPIWMLALPPRGMHEYRNLRFAHKHGIVFAELNMSGTQTPTIAGLQLLKPSDIPQVLSEQAPAELEPGLLGSKSIWE